MLTIYYKKSCTSSRKALKLLDSCNVSYFLCSVKEMQKVDLVHILSLTENGLDELLKLRGGRRTQSKIDKLYRMTLNEALDYLLECPEIIKTPILTSKDALLIGYHDAEIHEFISHNKRLSSRAYDF